MLLLQSVRSMATRVATRGDLTKSFDFVRAEKKDISEIVHLMCTGFRQSSPLARAFGLTFEDSKPLFDYETKKSVHYPFSYKVIEKDTNRLIGFRLMSVGYRDHSKEYSPSDVEEVPLTENVVKLGEIIDKSKTEFWDVVDANVQKVLRREFTFIMPDYQRKGIAKHLLHLGIDFEELKKSGFDGVVSESSAVANHTLLSTHGYDCVLNYEHNGNEGLRVYFKDLRK